MPAENPALKWLTFLGVPALLAVAVLNPDGWGAFLTSLATSFLIQCLLAWLIYRWLFVVVRALLGRRKNHVFSARAIYGMKVLSFAGALPLLVPVLGHITDVYELIWTVLAALSAVLYWFFGPGGAWAGGGETFRSAARMSDPPDPDYPEYQTFLNMLGGDRGQADRLIEAEKTKHPNDSWASRVDRALEHLRIDRGR